MTLEDLFLSYLAVSVVQIGKKNKHKKGKGQEERGETKEERRWRTVGKDAEVGRERSRF